MSNKTVKEFWQDRSSSVDGVDANNKICGDKNCNWQGCLNETVVTKEIRNDSGKLEKVEIRCPLCTGRIMTDYGWPMVGIEILEMTSTY